MDHTTAFESAAPMADRCEEVLAELDADAGEIEEP